MTPSSPRAARSLLARSLVHVSWLLAFTVVPAVIAVHARDSLPAGLRYGSSAEDVVRTWTVADPASFVRYGRYLLSRDAWAVGSTGCWPPGMGVLNAALFTLSGEGAFVGKTMAVSVVLWGAALYGVFRTLAYPRSVLGRFLVVNAIWLFSSFRYWLLITASIFSESKALPLFVLGLAFFVRGLQTGRYRYHAACGVTLAAAAYLRAIFDATIVVGFAAIALVAGGRLAAAAARDRVPVAGLGPFVRRPAFAMERHALKLAGVVLVTAVLLLMPWKLRNHAVLGAFSLRVCSTAFVDYWSYDMPSFLVAGNAGCVALPELCASVNARIASLTPDEARRLTLYAIVSAPHAYAAHKLRHFSDFWVGTPWAALGSRNRAFLLEGAITFAAGTLALGWALRTAFALRGPRAVFSAFFLGFCLQNLLVFTVVHFEYRYSLPIRLFFFYAPWWMASLRAADAPGEPA